MLKRLVDFPVEMGMELLEERGIPFYAPTGKITAKLPVFYNPAMTHNRDISVLILKAVDRKTWNIALPLAATGIRGIRLWKELGERKIKLLRLNDGNAQACQLMGRNLVKNEIKDERISIEHQRATIFLAERGADYIDVDPFGFPGPYLDGACRQMTRGGILAVTATDCGALCGSYPRAGKRKYWAQGLRNMFMHESGLRILARRVQLIAAQYDRAAIPIFSYSKDHYMRIFFSMIKGRTAADGILEGHGSIAYCEKCLSWDSGKYPDQMCTCGQKRQIAGPLYLGQLWDHTLIQNIAEDNPYADLQSFLDQLVVESKIDSVGFYDLHMVAKYKGIHNIPKRDVVMERLKVMGHEVSTTHFTGKGIRTHAKMSDLLVAMKGD